MSDAALLTMPAVPAVSVEPRRRWLPRLALPAISLPWWATLPFRLAWSGLEWVFGLVGLIIALAVLATVPLLQFVALGYMLEAAGRVARTGSILEGLPGVRRVARLAAVGVVVWLLMMPGWVIASLAHSADLIDPGGPVAHRWRGMAIAVGLLSGIHIAVCLSDGAKLSHLLWPVWTPVRLWRRLRSGGLVGWYCRSRDDFWEFLVSLRLPQLFWLGLRGFLSAGLWLAGPVTLMAMGRINGVFFAVGAIWLAWTLLHLPFAQMRFAAENRLAAGLDRRAVAGLYRRSPWVFAATMFLTLAAAVPLYLAKIEVLPREAAWLPGLLFIATILPAKLLAAWAYSRSVSRPRNAWLFSRLACRLFMLAAAAIYVGIVSLTQYTSWHGVWSLYEQHAFLLPAPLIAAP